MKLLIVGIAILGLAAKSYAAEACEGSERWDTLEHTFSAGNLLQRQLGLSKSLPRSIAVPSGATCVNQVGNSVFYGIRQQLAGDAKNNIVGLYDVNGIIAGVQMRLDKAQVLDAKANFNYAKVPMFQTEVNGTQEYFVITAYFVPVDNICSGGRTLDDLNNGDGTGSSLSFQNGATPQDGILLAPTRRAEALELKYSNNQCFPGMGNHTFYNVENFQPTNCTEIFPVFLLQNVKSEGCLVGFGLNWIGNTVSPLVEHPPALAVKSIVGPMVPQCLVDYANAGKLSTIHFFFTKRVQGCGGLLGTGLGK